jgi:glycosyltransferase involved in cell wall biosynthesis
MGSNSVFAEQTYELGFQHITIGRWLSRKLRGEVGADSAHFEFGADLNLYRPDPAANPAKPTVCFIHQPDKPRRGAELGLKALSWVQEKRPDVSLVLYGSDLNGPSSLNHKNLRLVKPRDCAKIYQSSTVGLSLSLTNPSRVPFEMMACGLPVVELHRDSTVWDFPEDAMLLSKGSPEALGNALLRILDDAPLRENMSAAGIQFMKSRDESVETQQFMTHFNGLVAGGKLPDFTTGPLYERGPLSYSGPVRPPVQPLHYSRKTVAKRWLKAHAQKILYELRKK